VLVEASKRASVSINFSIPTLDPHIWSITEPGTPPPRSRLKAIERLVSAGIKAGVGMAPILPGLSDDPAKIADVVKAARDAGATFVWGGMLYLQPGTREHFLETIDREWPELTDRYRQMYAHRAYLQKSEAGPVEEVQRLRKEMGIADRRRVRLRPPEPPSQMVLSL